MSYIDILGWVACIITIIYTAIGLPDQVKKNYKLKSTEGLSLFLFCFLFLTFTSWVVYGICKPDWFIVVPNGLGAIFAFIIVLQIIFYGSKNK